MSGDQFSFGMARGGRDRFFKKGNLQYVILQMLGDEPKHGYQIIKELEEKFKGFYSPSPGSVYPILQMLEDREFVSTTKDGKKKVYTITEEGRDFLQSSPEQAAFQERMEAFKHVDFQAMQKAREELQSLFKQFMLASKEAMSDEKKKEQLNQIIKETQEKLNNL
ncbi:PadR family transcriptional regulator [Staphylococcus sp. SQ8-PEA]|uniref:PadR family transcriptional regulator n=2 Tax=Staphylococcus marylandisciuri TaxID=2981529 RepID=A0ABT2QNA6_9STAP|nr:PadR family transcriptional regulator [Staphylococcus marylandisciuri]MCU5745434.1 PadR family transcriptional regulator [Staphylococcus marylandisciuri]